MALSSPLRGSRGSPSKRPMRQAAAPRSPPPADGSLSSRQQDILAKLGDAAPAGQPTTGEQPATGTSRRQLFNAGATVLGACMCGVCGASPVRAAAPGDWGYTPKPIIIQQAGPYAWGATCAVGNAQSPVDLPFSKQPCATKDIREEPVKRITTRYRETERCCITNAGHGTMQVNFPQGTCMTNIGNKKLELLQFHFHTPSEHMLNTKRFAMEAHLVHREVGTDELTVLGVMLQRGKGASSNPCLRKALDMAPAQGGKICNEDTNFNPVDLLPDTFLEGRRSYINYFGSLTTPPCTEGVNWYVYTDPIKVADKDIIDFMEFSGGGAPGVNARPVYPMNDREWILYKEG